MASVQKTIDIIFAGTDKVSGTISTISGNIANLGDKVNTIAEPLSNVADTVLKVNAALVALSGAGLVYAFNKSKDYESSIIDLEKVMGENESVTKDLEDQFKSLSRTYGESTIAIVNSLAGLRQSGYETADGMEVLETSMKLARASELSAEEATNFLKRTLIGYNFEASKAIEIGNLWNRTSNVANTNVSKLAEGFAIVSRQAMDAGFSLSETSAALTPVIGVFDSGSEAGIALSMALTSLLNPTKEGEEAIRKLTGVSGPLNSAFKDGKELFEAVAVGLQKVDARTAAVATAQIVGARQAKRVKVAFDDYFNTLEKIGPASAQYNSLQKEVDVQNASTQASVDRLKSGFESLSIMVGSQFRESAKQAIDGGTAIENALEEIISAGTFKPIFDELSKFSTGVGEYLKDIAKAMPEAFEGVDWSGLIKALNSISDGFGELFEDIDLTKPDGLTKAIQFVIDSLESLAYTMKGMINIFSPLLSNMVETIKGFNNLDEQTKQSAGGILGVAKAITILGINLGLALVTVGQHADTIKKIFETVINSIGFMWDSTVITVEGILIFVTEAAQKLAGALGAITFGDLSKSLQSVENDLKIFRESLNEDIASRAQDNLDRLNKVFSSTDEKIKETTKSVEDFSKTDADIDLKVNAERTLLETEKLMDDLGILVKEQPATVEIIADTEESEKKIIEFNEIVEAEIPSEKLLEIKLKGEIDTDIEKIRANADNLQASIEWTAKLNIAEAESNAKIFESMIDGISTSINNTGEQLSNLFTLLAGEDTDFTTRWNIEDQIKKENKMREESHKLQIKLNEAQLAYLQAKADTLESGEGLINISADGLEPEIEAFMWKILERIQIRATEENAEFLLGIS